MFNVSSLNVQGAGAGGRGGGSGFGGGPRVQGNWNQGDNRLNIVNILKKLKFIWCFIQFCLQK